MRFPERRCPIDEYLCTKWRSTVVVKIGALSRRDFYSMVNSCLFAVDAIAAIPIIRRKSSSDLSDTEHAIHNGLIF